MADYGAMKLPPKPHSPEWFAKFIRINPAQAAMTKMSIDLAKSEEVCTICGDAGDGRAEYTDVDSGLNVYLCDTCKGAQERMYGSRFEPLAR